jgi:transposase-like protein
MDRRELLKQRMEMKNQGGEVVSINTASEGEEETPEAVEPKQTFTKEFRKEVVAFAKIHGTAEAATKFAIKKHNVYNWMKTKPRASRAAPEKAAEVKTPMPEEKTAAAVLRSIGLDPKEWSIVHSSGLRLR